MSDLKIEDIKLGQVLELNGNNYVVTGTIMGLDRAIRYDRVLLEGWGWENLADCSVAKSLGQVLYEMLYPVGNYNTATNTYTLEKVAIDFKKYLDDHQLS